MMKQSHKTLVLWVVLILMFLAVYHVFTSTSGAHQVAFSEFMADVRGGRVVSVRIKEHDVVYQRRSTATAAIEERATSGPLSQWELQRELIEHNVVVNNEKEENTAFATTVMLVWLPIIVLLGVVIIFMRQVQAGGGKAMSFGKSRARLVNDTGNRVTFADVAGIEEAKDEVEEIIAFLKDPKKFRRLGGRIPKGVLLMGPPGTGKTLLARAIAGEAGVPFFSISGSDFVEMFVGVGASRVRDLFEQGKKHAPCIIFIDEIDAVGRHRGAGMGGGHDEREQTLNQLLVEMDGFDGNDGVIITAATNRPDVLDPAILRPGRFDRRIIVPRPDVRGREQILKVHTRKVPLATDVELEIIARATPGMAGADLENLVNEAALLAARQDKDVVSMSDLERAKDKVLMGTERRTMVISEQEKRVTAWHEAGHALVAMLVPGNDPVHKVSIIPRGPSLGQTMLMPLEHLSLSREQALGNIAFCLGGRVAEQIAFGQITTGAADDIRRATEIARVMVCEVGMSEKLGPVAYKRGDSQPFMGRDFGFQEREYSEETAVAIDGEIRRIVHEQLELARRCLEENRGALDRLGEALLVRETLDLDEVRACVEGRPLPERVRVVVPTWGERREKRGDTGRASAAPKPANVFPPGRTEPSGA